MNHQKPQSTVAGVASRINTPLKDFYPKDESMVSVFVDVACYAKWIQEQCKRLDADSNCTFNDDPKPKEEICPGPYPSTPGTGNLASHLESNLNSFIVYNLFLIVKVTSIVSFYYL